jgi:hypothetical protein
VQALVAVVAQASTVGQQVQVVTGLGAADAAEPPDALDAAVDEGVNEPQDNQGDVGVTRDE